MPKRKRISAQAQRVQRRRTSDTRREYRRFASTAEMKFHDLDIDDAVVAGNGTIQADLLTIPEGNGEEQRIGRKLTIKRILWRYNVLLPTTATAGNTSDIIRVMLILDKQANGAQPAITDILESDDYQSFNSLANSQRFRILYDKTHAISCGAGSGRGTADTLSYGETELQDSFFKSCNIPIEYDNSLATGAITTIRSNNITALLLSRGGLTGFTSKIRFRFTDR